jgi:hypothetical protein
MGFQMKITDEALMASKNYRFEYEDTEYSAMHDVMRSQGVDVGDGRPTFLYNSLEEKFLRAVNVQKDLYLTYGRSSGRFTGLHTDLITTKDLPTSPGLFEFLEGSYTIDHNPEGNIIELLQNQLPPLWHDKVPIDQRRVEVFTGTGGLRNWNRDAKALDVEGVQQTADLHYTSEEGFFKGRKGVGLAPKQYRSVFIEPFGEVRINYLPLLDSKLVNSKTYKGLPISSYEYIIFDYGYGDVRDANIYVVENKEVEQYGYSVGTWGPLGPTLSGGNRNRFHAGLGNENAFMYIYECATGFVMRDPSAMIYIRPTVR